MGGDLPHFIEPDRPVEFFKCRSHHSSQLGYRWIIYFHCVCRLRSSHSRDVNSSFGRIEATQNENVKVRAGRSHITKRLMISCAARSHRIGPIDDVCPVRLRHFDQSDVSVNLQNSLRHFVTSPIGTERAVAAATSRDRRVIILRSHPPQGRIAPLCAIILAACRTHEKNGQILQQMESTTAFSATIFLPAGNLDSFVSLFG